MCTQISDKYVVLRKDRKCDGCCKKLLKGDFIKRESLAEDGHAYNLYFCDLCEDLRKSSASIERSRQLRPTQEQLRAAFVYADHQAFIAATAHLVTFEDRQVLECDSCDAIATYITHEVGDSCPLCSNGELIVRNELSPASRFAFDLNVELLVVEEQVLVASK